MNRLVLLAFIPVILGLLIDGVLSRKRAIDDAIRSRIEEVTRAGIFQQRRIDSARELLAMLSAMPEVAALDGQACGARLRSLIRKLPNFVNVGLLDSSGKMVCSALGEPASESFGNRSYFTEARDTGKFSVSEVTYGRLSGSRSIIFGYPLYDHAKRFLGVAFATLADKEFAAATAGRRNVVSKFEYFDRHGNLITADPRGATALATAPASADILRASDGISVVERVVDRDGGEYIAVLPEVENMSETSMFVRGVLSVDAVLAPWRAALVRRSVAAVATLLCGLILAGWFLRKWLASPGGDRSQHLPHCSAGPKRKRQGKPGRNRVERLAVAYHR